MYSISTQITFSQTEVDEFGRLTGDDGPVHSVNGVVQGGLIIGSLPKFFGKLMIERNLLSGYTHNVSMILEAKFRNKLTVDKLVNIEFTYKNLEANLLKLDWRVFDNDTQYCNGKWVIYKSKN